MAIRSKLRRLAIERAKGSCEYCGLSQVGQEATFHVDHVVPVSAGGPTEPENLALACVSCSLRKGARETNIDPQTGTRIRLFHPRLDDWNEHFSWDGPIVIGLTAIGRATIEALKLNRELVVAIRKEELLQGRFPSS